MATFSSPAPNTGRTLTLLSLIHRLSAGGLSGFTRHRRRRHRARRANRGMRLSALWRRRCCTTDHPRARLCPRPRRLGSVTLYLFVAFGCCSCASGISLIVSGMPCSTRCMATRASKRGSATGFCGWPHVLLHLSSLDYSWLGCCSSPWAVIYMRCLCAHAYG